MKYKREDIAAAKEFLNSHDCYGFVRDVPATDDDAEQLLWAGWKPGMKAAHLFKPKRK